MTNCTKMVEKNTDKHCNVSSHSRANSHHKGLTRPNVGKGATRGPSHVRSPCTVAPVKGKHRRLDDHIGDQESVSHTSSGASIPEVRPSGRGSPNSRHSPSREKSPRTSPSLVGLYAGAKFSEPPSPTTLPKPPTHWTANIFMATGGSFPLRVPDGIDMYNSNHLKMLLKVSV